LQSSLIPHPVFSTVRNELCESVSILCAVVKLLNYWWCFVFNRFGTWYSFLSRWRIQHNVSLS